MSHFFRICVGMTMLSCGDMLVSHTLWIVGGMMLFYTMADIFFEKHFEKDEE